MTAVTPIRAPKIGSWVSWQDHTGPNSGLIEARQQDGVLRVIRYKNTGSGWARTSERAHVLDSEATPIQPLQLAQSRKLLEVQAKGTNRGEIRLYADIGAGMFGGVGAEEFAQQLDSLGDVSKIDLRIHSAGGDVFEGLTMYQALKRHPAVITTHVDGIAASIASVIALAGDEVRMADTSRFMIHNPWAMSLGTAQDFRAMADQLDSARDDLVKVYMTRWQRSEDELLAAMDAETWFTSDESLVNGFADTVIEGTRLAAHAAVKRDWMSHDPPTVRYPVEDARRRLARLRS